MKRRLTLDDLRVKSFVTDKKGFDARTVKGGALPGTGDTPKAAPKTAKWFCGGDEPDGGETILNICETVYYDC